MEIALVPAVPKVTIMLLLIETVVLRGAVVLAVVIVKSIIHPLSAPGWCDAAILAAPARRGAIPASPGGYSVVASAAFLCRSVVIGLDRPLPRGRRQLE